MLRRLIWSTIIAFGIMAIVMPLLYLVYPSAEDIPEAQRTVAQQISIAQRNASFFTLTIIIGMLAWQIGFHVSNEYFRQHPDTNTLIRWHKIKHPEIPDVYYKSHGIDRRISDENVAEDKAHASSRTENKETQKEDKNQSGL